ncbi:hypothetical protein K2173_000437 [Erythroxylum novogranatense]|uniref:RING-type E3 ubiquitin transferase n=1 Tax=Erythroxylum novogranatense TaxID=1862640 RepID=A0AAV8SX56_9ROSI|nr:hypothetical protein K2173_000437 [Erythroxylum novogranatense]
MDDYSSKRTGHGLVVSRKATGLLRRDDANNRDQNIEFCNRIGCSGRLNSAKGIQITCPEKGRSSRPSFRSSLGGKETIGSSSRTCSALSKSRKCLPEPRKKLSHLETDSSETSSVQEDPEVPALQGGLHHASNETRSHGVMSMGIGSSSLASSARSHGNFHKKSVVGNQDNLVRSPVSLASKNSIHGQHPNSSRYGMKNIGCNSITGDVPPGSSTSVSNSSRKRDMIKKRISDGGSSSSAKGKKMNGLPVNGHNTSFTPGVSISDSRPTRNGTTNRDSGAPSFRTRRSLGGCTRTRVSNQGSGINLSPNESHVMMPQMSQPDLSIDLTAPGSSNQFSMENFLTQPGSSIESFRGIRPSSPAEFGNNRSMLNREGFRRYNMDGIAEVLLALERIERDEVLTYEVVNFWSVMSTVGFKLTYEHFCILQQLLVLETNLFLNGLSFYDQHRDMRLDIDNMSYEELLALEERMGTVSTALPEEALSKCLKTSIYGSSLMEDTTTNLCTNEDDVKCSVCQEEYATGDEVGRLQCQHMFHVVCIHEWLRLKNWCPVCKASLSTSSLPSSS